MAERTTQAPKRGKGKDREVRLGEALRENLKRRKQQARARKQRHKKKE